MCQFPKCKKESAIQYIGVDLCMGHWDEIALVESKSEIEVKLLKKIGLERNADGETVVVK